mgnify:CR=1 FL=1
MWSIAVDKVSRCIFGFRHLRLYSGFSYSSGTTLHCFADLSPGPSECSRERPQTLMLIDQRNIFEQRSLVFDEFVLGEKGLSLVIRGRRSQTPYIFSTQDDTSSSPFASHSAGHMPVKGVVHHCGLYRLLGNFLSVLPFYAPAVIVEVPRFSSYFS